MYAHSSATRSRWAVAWIAKKRIIRKDFGEDFAGARDLYVKACKADKKAATLICLNHGFDPPPRLQPRTVRKVRKSVVMRRGKRRLKKEIIEVAVTPMKELNLHGVWWCPRCAMLRKFVQRAGFYTDGIWVSQAGHHCPICDITHRDSSVRRWNPVAGRIQVDESSPKRRSRTTKTSRRRRR